MLTYRSMRAHQVEGCGLRPPMNRQQEALDGGAAPRWLILSRRLLRPSAWTCYSVVPTVNGLTSRRLAMRLAAMDSEPWSPPEGSWASSEATRKKMMGNRSRDTSPELRVRSLVHGRGLRYRVAQRPIPTLRRTADLVFRSAKVAVFIDGCYWHGCDLHYREPRTNTGYWRDKIEGNRRRDQETDALLGDAGWEVLRFWEHEDPEVVAQEICTLLASIR